MVQYSTFDIRYSLVIGNVICSGQPCTLQFLPALQIITMPENTQSGDLVARLQITGSASEISTRLIYNSTDVKTNGTDYFTLNFTDLYLRSCECRLNVTRTTSNETTRLLALDYDWWTANGYPNPFRFIVQCTVRADQSIHDIDFQLDLIDVNDNEPSFSQSVYHVDIVETTPVDSIVFTGIAANDPDSGVFGTFSYSILNDSSTYTVSNIDCRRQRSATLVTRLSFSPCFDWSVQAMPVSFSLMLSTTIPCCPISISPLSLTYDRCLPIDSVDHRSCLLQDNGNPPYSSQAIVAIHLIDIDNLDPKFTVSTSYQLNISIDTSLVCSSNSKCRRHGTKAMSMLPF
jgi:hypothetical protein